MEKRLGLKSFDVCEIRGKRVGVGVVSRNSLGATFFPLIEIPDILRDIRTEHGIDAKTLNPITARELPEALRKKLACPIFPIGLIAFDNAGRLASNIVFSHEGVAISIRVPRGFSRSVSGLFVPDLSDVSIEKIGSCSYEVRVGQPDKNIVPIKNLLEINGRCCFDLETGMIKKPQDDEAMQFSKMSGSFVGPLTMRMGNCPENDAIEAFHTTEQKLSVVIQVEGADIERLARVVSEEREAA